MAEQATTPAAPAVDYDLLAKSMAPLIGAAVSEAFKPLGEQIGKLSAAAAPSTEDSPAPAKGKQTPLTHDDVKNLVGEALKEHSKHTAAHAARERYAAEKLKDVPAVYHRDLPETDDPAQLAAAEQKIRSQYQADFKASGATQPANVGGPATGGASPIATGRVDTSKLSAVQKIEMGLKGQQPQTHRAPAAAAAAEAGQG